MRSKDNLSTKIKALSYLLFPNHFIHQLVEVDYKKQLISNTQLANASNEKKQSVKADLLNGSIDRAKLIRKRLSKSLFCVVSACIIPIIIFPIFSTGCLNSILTSSNILAISSVVLFAWATLGRLGWKGQTINGDTVFEQLDNNIFWFQYWLGTLLATFAFLA